MSANESAEVGVKAYRPDGYTESDQRSDTSFLVGVRYGRQVALREAADLLDEHALRHGDPADNGHVYADLLRNRATDLTTPGAPS